jgi:transposase
VSVGVVSKTERRAARAGLDWAAVEALDDGGLEQRMYGGPKHARRDERALPDPAWMHAELRRPGVTLELLHLEYLRENPNGFRYTAFCDAYRRWMDRRGLVMRQHHKAGDKTFVDYSGKKPHIIDGATERSSRSSITRGPGGASSAALFLSTAPGSSPRPTAWASFPGPSLKNLRFDVTINSGSWIADLT